MAKLIPLSKGQHAIVDDADYEWLSQWKWCLHASRGYAVRNVKENGKCKTILMHALILGTPKGLETDHSNQNRLDNRRRNLRIATRGENQRNKGKRCDNTSGFAGVYFDRSRGKFSAEIHVDRKKNFLGRFATAIEASAAYVRASVDLHGDFSPFNLARNSP